MITPRKVTLGICWGGSACPHWQGQGYEEPEHSKTLQRGCWRWTGGDRSSKGHRVIGPVLLKVKKEEEERNCQKGMRRLLAEGKAVVFSAA